MSFFDKVKAVQKRSKIRRMANESSIDKTTATGHFINSHSTNICILFSMFLRQAPRNACKKLHSPKSLERHVTDRSKVSISVSIFCGLNRKTLIYWLGHQLHAKRGKLRVNRVLNYLDKRLINPKKVVLWSIPDWLLSSRKKGRDQDFSIKRLLDTDSSFFYFFDIELIDWLIVEH